MHFQGSCFLSKYIWVYIRHFWLLRFQSQHDVIRCISDFDNLVHWKMLAIGEIDQNLGLGENGEGEGSEYLVNAKYFFLSSILGNFEVIRCISDFLDFQHPCILKMAGHRENVCMRYFWLLRVHSQYEVIQYIFVFLDLQQPCISKMAGWRLKRALE